jgi:sterol-4alpha-carboxylate 3-dehydrogenase (decarboxylating)
MGFFEFVGKLLALLGLPPILLPVPYSIVYAAAAAAEALDTLRGGTLDNENGMTRFAVRYMCTHHYFNIEKARRQLGWQPTVSIDEGLRRTAAHLRAIGAA